MRKTIYYIGAGASFGKRNENGTILEDDAVEDYEADEDGGWGYGIDVRRKMDDGR